jgi:hypothetical protein
MKIDRDIPIPERVNGRKIYPFDEMEVGDSFFVEAKDAQRARNAVFQWKKRRGREITVRSITEGGVRGLRIWRTA